MSTVNDMKGTSEQAMHLIFKFLSGKMARTGNRTKQNIYTYVLVHKIFARIFVMEIHEVVDMLWIT